MRTSRRLQDYPVYGRWMGIGCTILGIGKGSVKSSKDLVLKHDLNNMVYITTRVTYYYSE